MGELMYAVAEDGEFVCYGKFAETYLNHIHSVAMLLFLEDKLSTISYSSETASVKILRSGEVDEYVSDKGLKLNDVSDKYLNYAYEEISVKKSVKKKKGKELKKMAYPEPIPELKGKDAKEFNERLSKFKLTSKQRKFLKDAHEYYQRKNNDDIS